MVAQKVHVHPAVVKHCAAHAQGKGAVGAGVHGHEAISLLGHGAVGNIDHGKLSALVALLQDEVGHLLLGYGGVAAPDHVVLGAPCALGVAGEVLTEDVGPLHRSSNIAIGQNARCAHNV